MGEGYLGIRIVFFGVDLFGFVEDEEGDCYG